METRGGGGVFSRKLRWSRNPADAVGHASSTPELTWAMRGSRPGAFLSSTLQFLGAAGTVTGSKHLVRSDGRCLLLDCGLFQGLKELRLRNWRPLPLVPAKIDAVVLSHAHVDHSGYLPLLVRNGFRGPIVCTPGTRDLLRVLLLDAAHLQEEEAEYANRRGYSKHHPALPLYTVADAKAALGQVEVHPFAQDVVLLPGVLVRFRRASHILGSATVETVLDHDRPVPKPKVGSPRCRFSSTARWLSR